MSHDDYSAAYIRRPRIQSCLSCLARYSLRQMAEMVHAVLENVQEDLSSQQLIRPSVSLASASSQRNSMM